MSRTGDGLTAGAVAAIVSGLPSTVHALATGGDPLEATRAAGSIVLGEDAADDELLLAAIPVHVAISLAWGVVLASRCRPGRRPHEAYSRGSESRRSTWASSVGGSRGCGG